MSKIYDILQKGTLQKVGTGSIIIPNYHDRTDVDEDTIEKLAKNISEVGQLSPILLEKKANGDYELISGLRRLRAFYQLVWTQIDAIVLEELDEESKMLIMITENAQRQNLNDYDLVVSLVHFLAVSTNNSDEDIKNFLYKINNHDSGGLKNLSIQDKKLQKMLEEAIEKTDKYKLKTLISKLKVLKFHPDIIKAMQERKLLYSYAVMLNKMKEEAKMKELLTLFTSFEISKEELKASLKKINGEDKPINPLKEITKAMKEFNNFSDEKKKMIQDKIDELTKLLTA